MTADAAGVAPLVDLAFPVQGGCLPRDHRGLLARALGARLPWLGVEPGTGFHALNLVGGGGATGLLSRHTRLTLRLARARAPATAQDLAGTEIDLDGCRLRLDTPSVRELLAHRTLFAHFVAAPDDDENAFLRAIDTELQALGVACQAVCGLRQQVGGDDGPLSGFSLMLDGLSPAHASRILRCGLGPHRRLGCGIFIAHRSAAAVGG